MRRFKYISLLILLLAFAGSCKKSNNSDSGLASVNFIQANSNIPSVAVNFTSTPIPFYLNQNLIYYTSSYNYGVPAGANPYVVVNSADTSTTLLQGTFNVKAGGIYSFYLSGKNSIDTLFMQDTIPVHPDSSAGVRFINLSPDSGPVNISLQGNMQNEFSSLGYRQITEFKRYSDSSDVMNNGGYTYVITDMLGNTLTTFGWNPPLYKNNTLVICGIDSLSSVQIFQVNNY
jgi:hypothetical protein